MAVTAGDGANDVFVSVCVDAGSVTGVGMDAVTVLVGATSVLLDFWGTVLATESLWVLHWMTV